MAGERQLNVTFPGTQINKIKLVVRNIARRMAEEDRDNLETIQNQQSRILDLYGQSITPQQAQIRFNALLKCLRGDEAIYNDMVFDVATAYITAAKQHLFNHIRGFR